MVAGLSGITTDYLYQIERGKKLPALPVAVQLARVLRVPLSTLLSETVPTNTALQPLEAGAAIHQALTWAPVDDAPLDVAGLHRQVEAAWRTWQSSERRYSQLGNLLPQLITAAERLRREAVDSPPTCRPAQQCAADLYGLVRTVAKRVGRVDLALLAADRGIAAAETASDVVRLAAARWNLAHVLLAQNQPEGAEAVAVHAAEAIAKHTNDDLDALAMQGSLQLVAAMASVRLGQPWVARDRVRAVLPLAERTGERNVCWTAFGPTNVAIFAVSVEVEAGDTGEGLRLAERVEPHPELSLERRVAFHLDQANAYTQRHDYAGAGHAASDQCRGTRRHSLPTGRTPSTARRRPARPQRRRAAGYPVGHASTNAIRVSPRLSKVIDIAIAATFT